MCPKQLLSPGLYVIFDTYLYSIYGHLCYYLMNDYEGILCNHSCVCPCLCFRDVAALSSPSASYDVGESPLRSHRHSWRQQIFLRVATPQKSTETNGKHGYIVDLKPCKDKLLSRVGGHCVLISYLFIPPKKS